VVWEIKDDGLDLASLRLEYRPVGEKKWLPLKVEQAATSLHEWDTPLNTDMEVRLRVSDKAGNQAESTVLVTPGLLYRP
jgi:hypothetical protein